MSTPYGVFHLVQIGKMKAIHMMLVKGIARKFLGQCSQIFLRGTALSSPFNMDAYSMILTTN